jgi:hypothetical protein
MGMGIDYFKNEGRYSENMEQRNSEQRPACVSAAIVWLFGMYRLSVRSLGERTLAVSSCLRATRPAACLDISHKPYRVTLVLMLQYTDRV